RRTRPRRARGDRRVCQHQLRPDAQRRQLFENSTPLMVGIRYTTIAAMVLAFAVAALVVRLAHVLVHRVLGALDIVSAENRAAVHARARQLIRALTILAYGVPAVGVISLRLTRFGVKEPKWDPRYLGHW